MARLFCYVPVFSIADQFRTDLSPRDPLTNCKCRAMLVRALFSSKLQKSERTSNCRHVLVLPLRVRMPLVIKDKFHEVLKHQNASIVFRNSILT